MGLEPGTVLDTSALGFTLEVIATGETTGGAYFEFDAVGKARGVVAQPHVHERQTEHFEMIEGRCGSTWTGSRTTSGRATR
jgi:hypothetical protein